MKQLTKMKDRFHLTLMISTDLYLDGLLNGEYFWYYICTDGKTTYMNERNPFMVLWTRSSLESVPECRILHLDCWVSWNTCNITSRQRAPYWLWAEKGPCALFISARMWAGARPWNVVQLYLFFTGYVNKWCVELKALTHWKARSFFPNTGTEAH